MAHRQVGRPLSADPPFRFNPHNAVTGGFAIHTARDGTPRVVKTLLPGRPGAPEHWAASDDPHHWNYWRREADVYRDRAHRDRLRGTGLSMADAEVHDLEDRIELHLELVEGRPGTAFDLDDHAALGEALGRWQSAPVDEPPWASRRFLRHYSGSKPAPVELMDDDARWSHPLVARHWPPDLRDGWRRLLANRDRLLSTMERLPRRVCHLDVWPSNLIARRSGDEAGDVVLLDWSFSGDGALGEDVGNHVPDGVFDLFWEADRMDELTEVVLEAYLRGLREGGWDGDERVVRLGMSASCVKYSWLLPLQLSVVDDETHVAYHEPADSDHVFHARGIGMSRLVDWCDEALSLADALNL